MAYVIESAYIRILSEPSDSVYSCDIVEGIGSGLVLLKPAAHLVPQLIDSLSASNVRVASTEGRIVIIGDGQSLELYVSEAYNVDYVINGYWIDTNCAQP